MLCVGTKLRATARCTFIALGWALVAAATAQVKAPIRTVRPHPEGRHVDLAKLQHDYRRVYRKKGWSSAFAVAGHGVALGALVLPKQGSSAQIVWPRPNSIGIPAPAPVFRVLDLPADWNAACIARLDAASCNAAAAPGCNWLPESQTCMTDSALRQAAATITGSAR